MQTKNSYYISVLAGVLFIVTQIFDYWSRSSSGMEINYGKVIGMSLLGISFMIPYPKDMPKLPALYTWRLLVVMIGAMFIGYSFAMWY
jgi:hypothetical protein